MKTKSLSLLGSAMMAAAVLFAAPSASVARDRDHKHHHSSHHHSSSHGRDYYYARPRSSFSISLGTGYAGRGYYYGPSGADYYYQRPGVSYYRTVTSIPREYGYNSGYRSEYRPSSTSASVQAALARRGYYGGPVDGDIGPGSRRAIARYQADHGLRPTGAITSSLLNSLGL